MERELDEELRFHFDRQVEEFVKSGMPPQEALRQARLAFGGLDQIKEECRQARGVSALETTIQDVRYSLRGMRRNPAFALIAVIKRDAKRHLPLARNGVDARFRRGASDTGTTGRRRFRKHPLSL